MSVYIVVDIDVKDQEGFEEYRKLVSPMIEKYGGRYLVRGGEISPLEGEWDLHRVVILEFPSADRWDEFYTSDEYVPVAEIRHRAADSRLFMVEGVQA